LGINLIDGVRRRESCFYFRQDTVKGVYKTTVCEKKDFKKPSLFKCCSCQMYTPYLSISELAKREKERYGYFLKKPRVKNCQIYDKTIKINNFIINKPKTNCNTLFNFVNYTPKNDVNDIKITKKLVQKKLC